jgi:hypothetical protein
MNNTSFLNLCETAEYFSETKWLWTIRFLRISIAILSIFLCAILFRIQGKHLVIHPNASYLLITHHIWAILQSVSQLIAYIFDVTHFSAAHQDPCQYLITTLVAVIVRGPSAITLYGQIWSLTAMAVERLVATVQYRTYESSAGTILGKMLIIAQVRPFLKNFPY